MKLIRSVCLAGLLMTALPALGAACMPGSADCAPANASTAAGLTMTPSLSPSRLQTLPVATQLNNAAPMRAAAPSQPLRCADIALSPLAGELQTYLCGSAGLALPVFGQNLFQGDASPFAAIDSGSVPSDYQMGVGDSFALRVWGQLDADLPLTVDRAGNVFIPKVGNVSVVGVPFGGLKQRLAQEIGKTYRNFELAVTMGQLRAVQVFVVGFAKQPGSYSVSSLSTIVSALYAAGGPSALGSLRNIELRRGGTTVSQFDFYDLVLKGDKSKDVLLQAGDVIYIPPMGAQAALYGAVKLPAIYELKAGETLSSLLDWAGGSSTYADAGKVSIERVDEQKKRKVESVELAQAPQFVLRAGDAVQVYRMSNRVEGGVTLRGSVAQELRMPWFEGMRVTDLIRSREALISNAFWSRAAGKSAENMADANSLRTDNSEVNWDYAVIERLNDENYTTTLLPFNLGKAVIERDAQANLQLQRGDVVHIYSKADIRVPSQKQARYVRLEGEVAVPGIYQVAEGETLQQLLQRIGGLTQRAYLYSAEFNREAVRIKQQQELNRLADYLDETTQSHALTTAQNALSQTDTAAAQLQANQQRDTTKKLRTLQASGRMVLGMTPDSSKLSDLPDLALEDGDRFFVPTKPTMVQVIGSVFNRNSAFIYQKNKDLGDYLAMSGGPTENGDANSIFVVRADGSVSSAKQRSWYNSSFESLPALPGDTVIVPEKVDRTTLVKNMMDWSQILANFGLGAAAIKTLGN